MKPLSKPSKDPMEVFRELKEIFDQIADEYSGKRRKPWKEADLLLEAKLVLDSGCGSGRHLVHLSKGGVEVVGVDLAPNMLKEALKYAEWRGDLKRVHVVACDMLHLPFRDGVFDGVLMLASLHHIPTSKLRLECLKEHCRVMERRGILVVSVWTILQLRFLKKLPKLLLDRLLGRVWEFGDLYVPWKSLKGKTFKRFYHLFRRAELKRLLEEAGFKVEKIYGTKFKDPIFSENHVAVAVKP